MEVVVLDAKDTESGELITKLCELRRKTRCKWSDCAVLYRTHSHRDQLAAELASQGIPFSIENMDVMDMPEARDLFACLGAVVSDADGASLFRVAALPQFAIDPEKLRAGIKALPRDAGTSAIALVLSQIEGGPRFSSACDRPAPTLPRPTPRAAPRWMSWCAIFPGSHFTRAEGGPRIRQRMGAESDHENRGDQRTSRLPRIFSRGRRSHPSFFKR